jgi:mRNA interferase RelE/StbE
MAEVQVSERAADWLGDAESEVRDRILSKLEDTGDFPDHFLKRLRGRDEYRLRVGDYRVIIDWRRDDDVLFVREIGHRRNVYD